MGETLGWNFTPVSWVMGAPTLISVFLDPACKYCLKSFLLILICVQFIWSVICFSFAISRFYAAFFEVWSLFARGKGKFGWSTATTTTTTTTPAATTTTTRRTVIFSPFMYGAWLFIYIYIYRIITLYICNVYMFHVHPRSGVPPHPSSLRPAVPGRKVNHQRCHVGRRAGGRKLVKKKHQFQTIEKIKQKTTTTTTTKVLV